MAWMVRHAASLVTWCSVGHDGQTAYQRVRQRQFTTRLLGFGESCSFRIRAHEPISNSDGGRRFNRGIFVGIDRRTGQYMLYQNGEIKMARTVMRSPDDEKYGKEELSSVNVTPWSMFEARPSEVIFKDKTDERKPADDWVQKAYTARRVYLHAADF